MVQVRTIPDVPTDPRLPESFCEAMSGHLMPRSVALLFEPIDLAKPANGSGTCIKIGDRHFVATAAHNLNGVKDLSDIAVAALWKPGKFSRQTPHLVASGRRGGGDFDALDIAWLEIEPRAIPSWEAEWQRLFVTLDRIRVGPVPPLVHACILAQPEDFLRVGGIVNGVPAIGLRPLPYMTNTVEADNRSSDLCMYYPEEMSTAEGVKLLPAARGISGAGIWLVNPFVEGVWTPEHAQLAGIQHHWRRRELLRGTIMREWLQMVREDIPALAPEIDPVLTR